MRLFSKPPKQKPTLAESLAALRSALRRAAIDAEESGLHPREIILAFDDATQNLRVHAACTVAVPEAASAALYDVERIQKQIAGRPTPPPAPRPAPMRGPRSLDAEHIKEWLDSCSTPFGQ